MSARVIQHVFRAVVVAKLSYASQAWSGFTSAADLQRLNAFLRRCIRQGFCSTDLTDITVIFDAADETLFRKMLSDGNHLLATLIAIAKFAHLTILDPGAIIGNLFLKSTNYVIAIHPAHLA